MFVRFLAVLALSVAPFIAGGSSELRAKPPEEAILGHWRVLYGKAEYFLGKDGRFIVKDEAGLISKSSWKVNSVDKSDDAVTIVIDPGPTQWELTLRYDSKGLSMMAEQYEKTPKGIRRSAVMWEWVGSISEPEEKKPGAKAAAPDGKPPAARDLPAEQAVFGEWYTLGGNAWHSFRPDGRYCLSGCADVLRGWSIVERTATEQEQGIMLVRTDVEYRLHFASDGRSILCEWFDNHQKPPRRVAQTWIFVKEPAKPADASPAPQAAK